MEREEMWRKEEEVVFIDEVGRKGGGYQGQGFEK